MAFALKLFYLAVFPGFLFTLLAGTLARGLKQAIPAGSCGQESAFPASSPKTLIRLLFSETIAAAGDFHALLWIGPAVKIFALSWISCIVFGFMSGDVFLLFTLLLVFSSTDLFLCWLTGGKRVRQQCWRTATAVIGWVVPLAAVIAAVTLRTDSVSVQGIIRWQGAYGSLIVSPEGGNLARIGCIAGAAASFLCFSSLSGMKPFGTRMFTFQPGDITTEFSGVPLAMLCASQTCALLVMPLVLVSLFFAGPASNWLEVLFWILKVTGALILMVLFDYMSSAAQRFRIFYWMVGFGGALALASFVLVWVGVGL